MSNGECSQVCNHLSWKLEGSWEECSKWGHWVLDDGVMGAVHDIPDRYLLFISSVAQDIGLACHGPNQQTGGLRF